MKTPPPRRLSGREVRADIAGELFDLVLSTNQLGTWQLEDETGVVTWDARMFELFGAPSQPGSEAEVWARAVSPEDRERVEAVVADLRKRGAGEVEVHFRIVRADGSERRLRGRTRLLARPGQPSFLFGVNWDVTDDLAVRIQLEEQQRLIEAAMGVARMGSFVWHLDGDTTDYSDALYALYRYTPTGDIEVDRASLSGFVHADDLPAVRDLAHRAVSGDVAAQVRFRVLLADGAERRFEMVAVPLKTDGRRRLVGMVRDVTDELVAIEGLRDANNRYGAVVSALPDMLVRIRRDGLILDFKPAIGSRAEASDFIGRKLSETSPTPPEITSGLLQAVAAVIAGHGPIVREVDAELPRWKAGTFECVFVKAGDDDAVLMVRDVSERKRTERDREEARQAAEMADRAKTVFLATVSHEMRTPLNGVLGLSDALASTALDPNQRRFLDAIRRSGETLLALVDDLLDLTRIESGRLRLQNEPFAPAAVVAEVLALLEAQAHDRGLWLRQHDCGSDGVWLAGDARRLRQIVINLVGNALKFTDRGGVDVRLRVHEVADSGGRCALELAVRDTGIGIPEAEQDRIFDAFTQVDGAATRSRGGTGLGLSISRGLASEMGGSLTVQSSADGGSIFVLRLALPRVDAPPQQPSTASQRAESGMRVLLVEDNAINRMVAVEQLRGLGVEQVDVADDGEVALQRAAETAYDLILMDLQLPKLDGYDATRRLQASPGPNQATPVVAMTAHALDDDRLRCREAGMVGYLVKPVSNQALGPWLRRRRMA